MKAISRVTLQLILIVATGFLTASLANAATYYVAKTGSDSHTCTQARSQSTPKLTIDSGIGCLASGDRLEIKGGTYTGLSVQNLPSGISWSSPTTISRFGSDTVIIQSRLAISNSGPKSYLVFDGLIFDARESGGEVIWIGNGSHHIRFVNCEMRNSSGHGILLSSSGPGSNEFINCKVHTTGSSYPDNAIYITNSDNLVEGCEIYASAGAGIQLFDDKNALTVNNNIIRYNFIHDTSGAVSAARGGSGQAQGITVGSGQNNQVYENVVANLSCAFSCGSNGGNWGIALFSIGQNNLVYNNTVYNVSGSDGIAIDARQIRPVVKNNIVWNSSNINDRGATSPTILNNLCNSGCSVNSDPLFMNVSASDFRLQFGSPAIDIGAGAYITAGSPPLLSPPLLLPPSSPANLRVIP